MSRKFIVSVWVAIAIIVTMMSATTAQDSNTIQYGQIIIGSVPAEGGQAVYTFSGNAGDLVTIRALGSNPDMRLNVALLTFTQQLLLISSDQLMAPITSTASIVYRLPETGTYYVVVYGSAGDFLLTLEARSAIPTTTLALDAPVTINLPFSDNQPRAFIFNTDPLTATTLLVDADPLNLNAYLEIRDGSGQLVSVLQGNIDNACINMGPGDEIRELTVMGNSPNTGAITVTLSNRNCELSDAPVEIAPIVVQPVPLAGVCAATSAGRVNIRSGPSTLYSIIGFLSPNQPIQVVGVSEDGRWFVVQNSFLLGWVSGSVVGVTGPCDGLPVFPTPPLPPAPPTPGMPLITLTPFVITGTPGPSQTPFIITTTPGAPTATTELTAVPTIDTTMTVIPTGSPTSTVAPTATP